MIKEFWRSSLFKPRAPSLVGSSNHGSEPIPSEEEFARMILQERRRTDRSGKPFLLIFMDIEKSLRNDVRGSLLSRICQSVGSSIRNTDGQGWHKQQSVLGVLFTELNVNGPIPVVEVIHRKIVSALASRLTSEELDQITFRLHLYPDHWGAGSKQTPDFDLYPDVIAMQGRRKVSRVMKRAIDIAGSLTSFVIFLPLFVLIAMLIRLTSRGPILFRQFRTGQYGRQFTLLKFRTMSCEADDSVHKTFVRRFIADNRDWSRRSDGKCVIYKIQDDSRVTPIGRLLRKTSLDELPQFWNVLKGEMSLIGPRPPIPYEVECYEAWHRRRLLEVKPGITGLWQVCGRSRTKFNEMVRLDLHYAKSWSFWLDLKILLRTPRAVISGDGAY